MTDLPYARQPCTECPWRKDQPTGRFPPERYEALRNTAGSPGDEAPLWAPMFACHKTANGREIPCAGWLVVAGSFHLGVRLAIATGRLPVVALERGADWPELYATYDEMATANGAQPLTDAR